MSKSNWIFFVLNILVLGIGIIWFISADFDFEPFISVVTTIISLLAVYSNNSNKDVQDSRSSDEPNSWVGKLRTGFTKILKVVWKWKWIWFAIVLTVSFLLYLSYRKTNEIDAAFEELRINFIEKEANEFIKNYPSSHKIEIIEGRLDSMITNKLVTNLIEEDSISLLDFIRKYPDHRYANFVFRKILEYRITPILSISKLKEYSDSPHFSQLASINNDKILFRDHSRILLLDLVTKSLYNLYNSKEISDYTLSKNSKYAVFWDVEKQKYIVLDLLRKITVFEFQRPQTSYQWSDLTAISDDGNYLIFGSEHIDSSIIYSYDFTQGIYDSIKIDSYVSSVSLTSQNSIICIGDNDDEMPIFRIKDNTIETLFVEANESYNQCIMTFTFDNKEFIVVYNPTDFSDCIYDYFDPVTYIYNLTDRSKIIHAENQQFIGLEFYSDSLLCYTFDYENLYEYTIFPEYSKKIKYRMPKFDCRLTNLQVNMGKLLLTINTANDYDQVLIEDIKDRSRVWGYGTQKREMICGTETHFINDTILMINDSKEFTVWNVNEFFE